MAIDPLAPTPAGGRPADLDPREAHLIEQRTGGEQVWRGHFLDVRRDTIALPDGGSALREYIVHPGAVMVVPVLDDGRLVMERQYRYPVGQVLLEFPAGKLDAGEPVQRCGQRELLEETGYRAREWARACLIHNACAYSTEGIEIWFARGLQPGPRQLDAGELIDLVLLTEDELAQRMGRGEVTDAKTQIGLLWLQQWRAGRWQPDWVPEA